MQRTLLLLALLFILIGCNVNPNKEERIQKLESTIQVTTEKVKALETKFKELEMLYEQLKQP